MSVNFIKMISEIQFERFNVYLAKLIREKTRLGIFFGFNFSLSNVEYYVRSFQNTGLNVTCICVISDTPSMQQLKTFGLPVVPLDEFSKFNIQIKPQVMYMPVPLKDLAFVSYFSRYEIESLAPLGIDSQENRFAFNMQHLPELYEAYSFFEEEESKKSFRAVIKGRLTGKLTDYHFAPEPQYFLEGFFPVEGDIAIDGGSFDGATSAAFAKCGAQVYAFEMDAVNYQNCLPRAEKFGFTIENMGLSDRECEVNYLHDEGNPAGSRMGGGYRYCQMY